LSSAGSFTAAVLAIVTLTACADAPPAAEYRCVVHSVSETSPGLVECSPAPETPEPE